ncbi:TetR/AcrR family transcriptional regulator [Ligilactobacillus acidipiscis]|uniref:TetR/AcrR family transcriptional regulator n=1 Tax=Ligilactobacillus acidipiscis TaxID=89059 RepID=UPI0023F92C99|nr:TetR/AcrR family transcriptional regulator [Ligilactobacillus acidipiscis]WEV57421.1 TetR/AcrR family transcriptional regulator [Ligilactobacillus acidipiscis]
MRYVNNNISSLFVESLNELNISERQKSVLQASLTLFSEQGFENTSTTDIAQMAGVAVGTVYQQFNNKEGLLQAVLEPVITEVIPKVASEFVNGIQAPQGPHFAEFLQNIMQDRMQFVIDNLPQVRILVRETMVNQKIRNQMKTELAKLPFAKLKGLFVYYQEQGQLVDWEFSRILRAIIGAMCSYLVPLIFEPNKTIDVAKASQDAAETLIKGLKP